MKKIKVTPKEYNKLMDKKVKDAKDLPVHEWLIGSLEWCSQYEIHEKKTKKTNKKVPR